MTYQDLLTKIETAIMRSPHVYKHYDDYFQACRGILDEGSIKLAMVKSAKLRSLCYNCIKTGIESIDVAEIIDLSNKTLLFEAPYIFDSYLQYIELNRLPNEKFYIPRRKQLLEIVNALQDLTDDALDELFVALPPRVGKTTLIMFFYTWIIGKDSELANLYSAFSNVITSSMYTGILEIITDKFTYNWGDVFPGSSIASTNAKDETININRIKRYPSMTCRSLYGTLNGACDCNGYLTADDLIGGIEEALNKDRLIAAWSKTDNNLLPRAKETAKRIWIGTRWSIIDPAGRRMDLVQNSEQFKSLRYKIINVPALNPSTDETNFLYKHGVGFTSEFYKQRRASFERNNDLASWNAQYMGEPVERDGTLFLPEDLKFYNGVLPDAKPDRILATCDPAWGGGDFVSVPCIYQYDFAFYVVDVVFDNHEKNVTQPKVVNMIIKHGVHALRVEGSRMTASYREELEKTLKDKGYKINITSKAAPTRVGKEQRIFDKAPTIREFFFLEDGLRSKDYSLFMQNLLSYKVLGKNKNDDAPDSLAMAVELIEDSKGYVEVFQRPF
jgi:predicted phage terminase large subunit-like protein